MSGQALQQEIQIKKRILNPSGIEWLGEVPASWHLIRLRYQSKINPTKSGIGTFSPDTEISFVPMESVGEYGGLITEQIKYLEDVAQGYTYFRDDDVVVAKITPCFENGKGAIAKNLKNTIGFGTTELHVIRAINDLDTRYLFYLSISDPFRKIGSSEMYGAGGQKRVPESFIKDLKLFIPDKTEQHSIADFLDEKTAKIDALIEKKNLLIELLKEKRTALISHAVTKGLDPNAKMKDSNAEWLGVVPEGWDVRKLKFIVKLKSGESITSEEIEETGEYQVFGGNGLRGYYSKYTHDGHFVLIGRQGALCGNINYGKGKFWASEHAVVATPNEKITTIWLGELLRVMNLNQYSVSAAQPGLAVDKIKELLCPYPSFREQEEIAEFIGKEAIKIDALVEKIQTAIDKLKEYRTALISAAVTGKIDVRSYVSKGRACQ